MKSFDSTKTTSCRFWRDAVKEVEQGNINAAHLQLKDPSNAACLTDEEKKNEELFNGNGLPTKSF